MKDFPSWHRTKSSIQNTPSPKIYFYEREIWFLSCGVNIGYEQDGKGTSFARPVIVVRKFNQHIFWGIPLGKTFKSGPYYHGFNYKADIQSTGLLSQLRLFDAKRLIKKDGTITQEDFKILKKKIRRLL